MNRDDQQHRIATNGLLLLSGLAADATVFTPQLRAFESAKVIEWIEPEPHESLDEYCRRLAALYRDDSKPVLAGASFGGIVALHLARHMDAEAVILIGSVKSPEELPYYARLARPLRPLIRFIPLRLMQACAAPLTSAFVRNRFPNPSGFVRQFRQSSPAVFKWSLQRILLWERPPDNDCPVYHIHGTCDRVLPIRFTHPDVSIAGGGHVISLFKASDVNRFIRSRMDGLSSDRKLQSDNGGLA